MRRPPLTATRRGRGAAPRLPSRVRRRRRAALVAAVLALGLGGCESVKGAFGLGEPPPPCPRVAVLGDAARITKFRPGPGRDLVDVLYEGAIENFSASCQHAIDRKTRTGTLEVEIAVEFGAARGPADRDRQAIYDYFVSVADSELNPIAKQGFSAKAAFEGNRTRFTFSDDPIRLQIPLKAGEAGPNFLILLGFQLTPDEMEFNRLQRGRGTP